VARERLKRVMWIAVGGLAPLLAATLLVPLRDDIRNANVALVLVAVVVFVAVGGGREAGAIAAVSSVLWFDLFHTQPYLELRIASSDDLEATLLLLVVGLVVGSTAARGRRARRSAEMSSGEILRIYRLANLAARGDDPADVIMGVQAELIGLLDLQDCRFEAAPYNNLGLPVFERSGVLSWPEYHRARTGGLELPPEGVALPVLGRGHLLGRLVLMPTAGVGVSLEQRVVAVALADQVGAVLAAQQSSGGVRRSG
jgi:hypothetical protein